jgi:putative transposase
MARYPRLVVPGLPHHVTQRGNRGQPVFRSPIDLRKYCAIADRCLEETGVEVIAFCLMPNHVHFVMVPPDEDSLSKTIHRMHTTFALYSNLAWGCSGHLWQGRFFSCALDETHFYNALRYVELNPVRAGMVERPSEYRWSSARAHLLGRPSPIELGRYPDPVLEGISDWSAFLEAGIHRDFSEIRAKTKTGRPCCSIETCHRIEEQTGRTVLPQPTHRMSQSLIG